MERTERLVATQTGRNRAGLAVVFALAALHAIARPSPARDARTIAGLDDAYQRAVEQGDPRAMARISDDRFVLVEGDGKRWSKGDIIAYSKKFRRALRASGRFGAHRADVRRHRRGHRQAVGRGCRGQRARRLQTMVQRHVGAHAARLALRLRPSVVVFADRGEEIAVNPDQPQIIAIPPFTCSVCPVTYAPASLAR